MPRHGSRISVSIFARSNSNFKVCVRVRAHCVLKRLEREGAEPLKWLKRGGNFRVAPRPEVREEKERERERERMKSLKLSRPRARRERVGGSYGKVCILTVYALSLSLSPVLSRSFYIYIYSEHATLRPSDFRSFLDKDARFSITIWVIGPPRRS